MAGWEDSRFRAKSKEKEGAFQGIERKGRENEKSKFLIGRKWGLFICFK